MLIALATVVGYGALLLGLPLALALVLIGVWSDARGSWWRTLGWLALGIAFTVPAFVVASLACFD